MIYLDYAAHTPAAPEILEEFCRAERQFAANPNSAHAAGALAMAEYAGATRRIARALGVLPEEIIHTSGASEANNLALKGLAHAYRHSGRHIISTPLEHPSVGGALTALQEQGCEVDLVDILPDGTVDLRHFRELLRADTIIAAVCFVDSELGAIQPIGEIAEILRDYPACHLHVDATQAVGKIPLEALRLAHCASLAPHKFHGLCGGGALVCRGGTLLAPQIHGGAGASAYRAGTPNTALAAAFALALELATEGRARNFAHVQKLRAFLLEQLAHRPRVKINSPANGSPYILNLGVSGVKGEAFKAALDARGICVSVKSACAVPGAPSRPVLAISRDRKAAMSSWRVSFSHVTTMREIEAFIAAFDDCLRELT